ncbi:MAG: hypothetical protein WDN04_17520 [Rhodospirillales bacterium]
MALSADTAALSAVKVGSNEFANGNNGNGAGNWQSVGIANGQQWYGAQVGAAASKNKQTNVVTYTLRSGAISNYPSVSLNRNGVAFTSIVGYSGSAPATFSGLFGVNSFPISGSVSVTLSLNAYVNIALLLDNSSSMLIGATSTDIDTMQKITACSPHSTNSGQGPGNWTGVVSPALCPTTYTSTSGTPPVKNQAPKSAACGFACHWSNDNQKLANGSPDYTQYDYFALARDPTKGPITGYGAPTLRFDVVQTATANVIETMKTSELITNQFGLSVFEFNSSLTQVYPAAGTEASTDLDSGETAVTKIVTPVVTNNGDTDFPDAMTALANKLTKGGDGATPHDATQKLVHRHDGIQDYGSRAVGSTLGPFSNSDAIAACNAVKSMGHHDLRVVHAVHATSVQPVLRKQHRPVRHHAADAQ